MEYKVGDEVYYIGDEGPLHLIGGKATIICIESDIEDGGTMFLNIGIEFKEKAFTHDCDGYGKRGYCAWVNGESITKDKAVVLKAVLDNEI